MSQDFVSRPFGADSPPTRGDVYEFGPFRVDAGRHEVTRAGQVVALAPKPFALLLFLVRREGRVATREELVEALWPDTFVEESNLTFQVWTLRKALGEGSERWVETVPRCGYRLRTAARGVPDPGPATNSTPPSHRTAARHGRSVTSIAVDVPGARPDPAVVWLRPRARSVLAVASTGLLVALAGLRFSTAWRSPDTPLGTVALPLAQYPNTEGAPSLSPDGSQVAFEWDGAETAQFDVYATVIGQGTPLRLTRDDTRGEYSPAWSPDGRRIAFLRGRAPIEIWVMAALGGSERRLAAMSVHGPPGMGSGLLAWSHDGRWLAVGGVRDGRRGLHLLEADGPKRLQLTEAPGGRTDYAPAFSPDGRAVAFVRAGHSGSSDLMVLPVGPDLRAVDAAVAVREPRPQHVIDVVWTPDGRSLVYALGNHLGASWLERLRLDDKRRAALGPPEPLPVGQGARGLDISHSGRLIYSVMFRDSSFWVIDLQGPRPTAREYPELQSTADDHTPHFSPDGRSVAFASTRTGSEEIWIADADGANVRQVTFIGGAETSWPRWSPDARLIAFQSGREGSLDLYALDVATGGVERLTSAPGSEWHPRWSRDGRWLYYASDVTGRSEIWKMPAAGGPAVQVTMTGGLVAEESVDGQSLYVGKWAGRGEVWRMSLAGRDEVLVVDGLNHPANFAVGTHAVYATTVRDLPHDTSLVVAALSGRVTVTPFGKGMWQGVALAPDERTLLLSAIDIVGNRHGSDLMIVEPR